MLDTNSLTDLLAFFFYEHRYLSLPELGRLELSGDSSPEIDENRLHVFPKGSISFMPNPSEKPDPELVEYITSRTRKMKALAIADLTSLSESAKEMFNIKQSFTFSGIATITPDFRGNYLITSEKLIPASHYVNKQTTGDIFRQNESEPSFQENQIHSPDERRTFGGAIIAVICVLIVAGLVYFLFLRKESNTREVAVKTEDNSAQPADSHSNKPQSSLQAGSPGNASATSAESTNSAFSGDSLLHYEVVFEQADSARAFRRYSQLTEWGHKIIIRKKDSLHYTLAVPVTSAISDTTAIKDSLRIFYGRPVYILNLSAR